MYFSRRAFLGQVPLAGGLGQLPTLPTPPTPPPSAVRPPRFPEPVDVPSGFFPYGPTGVEEIPLPPPKPSRCPLEKEPEYYEPTAGLASATIRVSNLSQGLDGQRPNLGGPSLGTLCSSDKEKMADAAKRIASTHRMLMQLSADSPFRSYYEYRFKEANDDWNKAKRNYDSCVRAEAAYWGGTPIEPTCPLEPSPTPTPGTPTTGLKGSLNHRAQEFEPSFAARPEETRRLSSPARRLPGSSMPVMNLGYGLGQAMTPPVSAEDFRNMNQQQRGRMLDRMNDQQKCILYLQLHALTGAPIDKIFADAWCALANLDPRRMRIRFNIPEPPTAATPCPLKPEPSGSTAGLRGTARPGLAGQQEDIAWFEANRINLARQYSGQWLVVKDQAVRGAYPDFQGAYNAGAAMFGTQPFLVKQALEQETPIRLTGGWR